MAPSAQLKPSEIGLDVAQRVEEGFRGLAGQGAAGGVGDGAGDHHRARVAAVFEIGLHGEHGGLGVQGVEDGFDQDDVAAALDQRPGRLVVGVHQLVEADVAEARVVDVRRQRGGAVGRAEHAGDKTRLVAAREFVGGVARQPGRGIVQLEHHVLLLVVGQRDGRRVEGVGLDNVRAGLQVGLVDVADDLRLGQRQQVVVALQVARPVLEAFPPVAVLVQLVALDHGAHGTVQDQDAFL